MNEQDNPWQVKQAKAIYDNPWISVTEYDVINPSGKPGIYGKVHYKNLAIGIVPLDEEGNTWLVGQYRFTLGQYTWELPEGGCPEHTDPLETAKRELLEETGLVAIHWEKIMTMHLSNSVTDEVAHIFLARGLEQREPEPEETEQLHIKKLPFNEVYDMVMDGRITDAITVAAILKLKILLQ
ncbi:MAG TPA: NUDIX hydrolase [Chitinophagaceae bacterium]|nr:NUDIX hydrolase [Chitinophagaceae bacterium]